MEVNKQESVVQKQRWKVILQWLLGSLLVVFIVVFFGINIYLSKSVPQTRGKLEISGLNDEVEVIRDSYGVPHIRASNEYDLFFTQGYVQAQDRLFQMDLSRRQASGTLSEVIGEAAIQNDKYFRTLGLRRAARASYEKYSENTKQLVQAYTNGVNSFIAECKTTNSCAVEFKLLGYIPKDWSPIDSLVIGKYMAFDLGGHWESQAFRYYLLQTFSEEKAYDLFPSYPDEAPYIIDKKELNLKESFADAVIPHDFNGSNNWVLSGSRTETGFPLLADDPHLSLSTPSIWYQMHLESPEMNVSGVIFAGIPGIILGHNEQIAWGVTNTGPDVQDLYIEKRNPDDETEFLYEDKWEKATVFNEPIIVKGDTTIPYTVTETRHGPVISEFAAETGKDTVLSIKWTALRPSTELEAIIKMNKATNWSEFEQALLHFHAPTQNFVMAAKDGTIAYKANGLIPIRKKGDGLLPVPGWLSEYNWDGYIPFNELPKVVNPKEGFIATANNKVSNDEYPYHMSHLWAQPYRQMRIMQFLQEKEQYTVADMKQLQMDQVNLQAEEFVPILLKHVIKTEDKRIQQVVNLLKSWNFVDEKTEASPLIFHTWMKNISDVLLQDEIPGDMLALFRGRKQAIDQLIRRAADGKPGPWIKDKGGLTYVVTEALQRTLEELTEDQGANLNRWKWGKAHRVQFTHPLSSIRPLNYLFNRERAKRVGGSSITVQAAAENSAGIVNHGASWRFISDLADLSVGYHIVGPGQSGHVKSRWYQNQFDDWVNGEYHPTSLLESVGDKLILVPKD